MLDFQPHRHHQEPVLLEFQQLPPSPHPMLLRQQFQQQQQPVPPPHLQSRLPLFQVELLTPPRAVINRPCILMQLSNLHLRNKHPSKRRNHLRSKSKLPPPPMLTPKLPQLLSSTMNRPQKTARLGPKQLVRGRAATKQQHRQRQKAAAAATTNHQSQ